MVAELTRDEACRLVVYDDATGKPLTKGGVCLGHPTIGIGRALDVNGITQAEALYLLNSDIDSIQLNLNRKFPRFLILDDARQRVLVNMAFNMGVSGLFDFHDMLNAVESERFDLAAKAMEDSLWFRKGGDRARRLVEMMRTGAIVTA